MLYKKELHDKVHVVHRDVDARYMWIRIKRGDLRELYIEICYFPPAYSRFAPLGESDALTCWNPKGGASTVDYLMGSPSLIHEIREFIISGRPTGLAADHAYLHS